MKTNFRILYTLLGLLMLISSCAPEDLNLGTSISKSDLKFSIVPDATDPNMIVLTSLTPNASPQWITPYGRSTDMKDTVKIAFPGEYKFVYGVLSGTGLVQADTVIVNITTTNLSYVNDPLWTALCGGAGESKVWVPDTGSYGFAAGFMSYADPSVTQEYDNFVINWDPGNSSIGVTDTDLAGTMTFDLNGGPHLTVSKPNEPDAATSGTYYLDADAHTLTTTDVTILRIASKISEVSNWTTGLKILTLNENQLRIAVMRTDPNQGSWWEVYNYVAKDYADSYQAVEPEPTLPTGWKDAVSETTSTAIKWILSPDTPFNWANLDGSLMNTSWTSADKYDSWTGYDASQAVNFENFSLTLNSSNNSAIYVDPSGNSTTGSYTLDDKGVYTFSGFTPNFVICGGWVTLSTTAENQWRITKLETDATGAITGMWVGTRSTSKAEYMVYHLIPQTTGSIDQSAAWVTAFVGKTFKPDVNWFVDWLNFDQSGGWTSSSTFGTDYTSNGWVWTAATAAIAESTRLTFEQVGDQIKATLTQDLYNSDGTLATSGYSISGKATFNPDIPSITFDFPLVDYTGSPGSWLTRNDPKGIYWTKLLGTNEWIYVSHGDATLSTIDTNGFWLGTVSQATGAGDSADQILAYHFVLAN